MADLSIGELAQRSGAKVPAIRYYEQAGLLPDAPRTSGRHRRYDDAAVARLDFIRHARALGFEVSAVRELLTLAEHPEQSCAEIDRIARCHLDDVDRRIAQLTALRHELQKSLDTCCRGRVRECRVIEALTQPTS